MTKGRRLVQEWWQDAWWIWVMEDDRPVGFYRSHDQSNPAVLR